MATLQDVRDALARGDKQGALALVDQVLTATPTAEGWVLASQIVDAREDKVKLLTKAFELDPNNAAARAEANAIGMQIPTVRAPQTPLPTLPNDEQQFDTDKVTREGGKTIYQEGVYEMLWDCKFCGTKKLLGKSQKFCPVCGAQQDAEWRYYPSDAEKVAVKDHRYVGADKVCPNCSSLNTADAEFCTRCGAPQSAASQVKAQAAREAAQRSGRGMPAGSLGFTTEDLDARQMAEKYGTPAKAQAAQRPRWQMFALIAVVVGVLGFIAFSMFAKRDETGYASGFNWERTIFIDRLAAVQGRSECPAPADAYNVSRSYEQVGSRSVPDGEDCSMRQVDQGDGTFRQERVCTTRYRSEPVMGYMCSYTVNRWGYSRDVVASGTKDTPPTWPVSNASGCLTLGCERESRREERYRITITGSEGKTYQCDLPYDQWQATKLEDTFTFKVRVVGGGIDCGTLQGTQ